MSVKHLTGPTSSSWKILCPNDGLMNENEIYYPSSFGLVLLTRRVDEGQPPASAGGMPETTLSMSDLVMI